MGTAGLGTATQSPGTDLIMSRDELKGRGNGNGIGSEPHECWVAAGKLSPSQTFIYRMAFTSKMRLAYAFKNFCVVSHYLILIEYQVCKIVLPLTKNV